MVHTDRPEEGQTRCERVHIHAGVDTCAEVLHTVGKRVSQLDICRRTGFLHVVTGDGDGVELRHVLRGIFEDIGDDLHGRVDIGVTHHELLEDIVLDGTCHLLEFGTLLESGVDIEREDRQHGAVHGHGDGHLVQRYTGEEDLHVLEGADGHTCFADVTDDTHVIGVIATVGREVKSDRQTFLTGREVSSIERIRFLCGGESGVLTDGPGTQRIHGAVRAS